MAFKSLDARINARPERPVYRRLSGYVEGLRLDEAMPRDATHRRGVWQALPPQNGAAPPDRAVEVRF